MGCSAFTEVSASVKAYQMISAALMSNCTTVACSRKTPMTSEGPLAETDDGVIQRVATSGGGGTGPTGAERRILQARPWSEPVHLCGPTDEGCATVDVSAGDAWGEDRTVSAEFLRRLLLENTPTAVGMAGLHIHGARIEGQLDLSWVELNQPLILEDCSFDEQVVISFAQLATLILSGSCVPGLQAEGVRVRGRLVLDGVTCVGTTILDESRIEGSLWIRNGALGDPSDREGAALSFDFGRIDGACDLNGIECHGHVSLAGATIGGPLIGTGGEFTNPGGCALNAFGVQVTSGVFLNSGFEATGEVTLAGATIGGLACTAGKFTNPDRAALKADGAKITSGVYLNSGFEATGEVTLAGAKIGGSLRCCDGSFDAGHGHALQLDNAIVAGSAHLGPGFEAVGSVRLAGARLEHDLVLAGRFVVEDQADGGDEPDVLVLRRAVIASTITLTPVEISGGVDLTDASAETLQDTGTTWPDTVALEGFSYEGLPETRNRNPTDKAIDERIEWVRGSADGYSPGPWEQLRQVYRQAGMTRHARTVGVAQQRTRLDVLADSLQEEVNEDDREAEPETRTPTLRQRLRALAWQVRPWAAPGIQAWSWLLRATVGYGFKTWRVLGWLAVAYVAGLMIFSAAWQAGGILPLDNPPRVFAVGWYTLDVLLPLVDLGQQKKWLPTPGAFWAVWIGWLVVGWYWTTILLGWLLGTVVIAGLSGILRRD